MSASDGYVVGTTKVVDHGPNNLRWNLVVIGDGYRATELATYHQDVQNFLDQLRNTPPFDTLFCGINVHRVDVVSTESGADEPTECGGPGNTPRTYFDATFCSIGPGNVRIERLLTVDDALALSVATTQVPERHQVLAIVNSSKYGGSGGIIATCSTEATSALIAIHEMGHSAFHLGDEYGGDGTGTPPGEPGEPNVTRNTDRNAIKWAGFIDAATPMPSACDGSCAMSSCVPPAMPPAPGAVGAYEGGIYSDCNTYRPLPSCYMRDYAPFCPVCSDVIVQTLQPYQPIESINLVTTSITFADVPAGMGGVGVTTHRAIVFEVVTCRSLTFRIPMGGGPTGGFGTPFGTADTVDEDPILPVSYARIWLSYTSTNPGDMANGTVTVQCDETGDSWDIDIFANTIARPRAEVVLVLDRSYSMTEDAGDAIPKMQKLREAANAFISIMQPDDGIGLVRFNQDAQRLMDVSRTGPPENGAANAIGFISGSDLNPSGNTSIGDGVVEGALTLADGQADAATPYDVTAMVVLTDGMWNQPPDLASVAGSITANTYAVGLGLPSNISVPALTTLCQGHNGFLLITGALTGDQPLRLSKYFLQILAGVTNAEIAADPRGVLDSESEHRIPFRITEADFGMDVILLSPHPQIVDFQLEAPDGTRITPATGPNSRFITGTYAAYYRCALPVLPAAPDSTHDGLWHAVLKLARPVPGVSTNVPKDVPKQGVPYELVAHAYSSLTFRAHASQKSYDVGATVRLTGVLQEYGVAVRGKVWAEITRPDGGMDVIPFQQDGLAYAAQYELALPGVSHIRVRARGETMNGTPFERERTLTATAVIGGDQWSPHDPGGTTICDRLRELWRCCFRRRSRRLLERLTAR